MPQTVPVQIADDALARAEALGMRREMEQMIDHALHTASNLRAVRVTLEDDPVDPQAEPQVVIWVHLHPYPGAGEDRTNPDLWEWRARTFSSDVCWNIRMGATFGEPDGR
jgi:hypothetical protein